MFEVNLDLNTSKRKDRMTVDSNDEKLNLDNPDILIGDKETHLISERNESKLTPQQLETYEKISRKLLIKLNNNELDKWQHILIKIEHIPDLILNRYQFQASTPDEKKWVAEKKNYYKTISQWLYYLIPGDKEPNSELILTEKKLVRPKAMQMKAILNLIVELFERKGDVFTIHFKTPADCLFAYELKLFEEVCIKGGLLTGSPQFFGKKDCEGFKENTDKLISLLSSKLQETIPPQEGNQYHKGNVIELVILWAYKVAAEDTNFRNGEIFTNYRKTTTKIQTISRREKAGFMLLKDGKEVLDGQKRPRPRR
jgi:hypothetical protein